MTEDDYISRLRAGWPKYSNASLEIIALADEAVHAFPNSARMWVMRGDLIQISPKSGPYPLEEALRSYQRAAEIAPELLSLETRQELSELLKRLGDEEGGP